MDIPNIGEVFMVQIGTKIVSGVEYSDGTKVFDRGDEQQMLALLEEIELKYPEILVDMGFKK